MHSTNYHPFFAGLLQRYPPDLDEGWRSTVKDPLTNVTYHRTVKGSDLADLYDQNCTIKVFHILETSKKRKSMSKRKALQLKMDLFDDYSYPKPFPKDMFLRLPNGSPDQAYLVLGQKGTGRTFTHIQLNKLLGEKISVHVQLKM